MSPAPIRALITGAAGQIGYSLIPLVAKGDVFGRDQPVILHLLDIPPMKGVLDGVVMEIHDCAYPLLLNVIATTDVKEAFQDIDAAFLVGSMPRREGMERKDLLAANVKIFAAQGRALKDFSKSTTKVLVVGNPANTNALICYHFAKEKLPARNFTAMTRLDQNRATAQVALKHKVPVAEVDRMIIWGNHSSTQFPDVSNVRIAEKGLEDFKEHDDAFISLIQKRGAAVIAARKLSSAMSAAKAAADHMHDWWQGTNGRWVSMGVISDDNPYKDQGVKEKIIFSFPVTVEKGEWKIVEGLKFNDKAKRLIEETAKELWEEKGEAEATTANA